MTPLAPGARLGPYEIRSLLGKGGMGEVYRARDTKLDREVAIKVLPSLLASDPDRLARFEREARTLASLNHPNIAAIYGLEEGPIRAPAGAGDAGAAPVEPGRSIQALVLELVEGPTLAELIGRGGSSEGPPPGTPARWGGDPPAGTGRSVVGRGGSSDPPAGPSKDSPLPLAEALSIAKQIADALEAAHENGIVHRDLKPANVKVRDDGTVKVLDFGLAKLVGPSDLQPGAGRGQPDLTASPTITSPALMTRAGVILGTAAYMSPEQARGRAVDRRADIWAFGCVLFEMLAGRRAFDADEVTDTLARVIEREPDWSALPGTTPPSVRTLIRRCLEKDPRRRLRDIGDARVELEHTDSAARGTSPDMIRAAPGGVVLPRWAVWVAGAAVVGLIAAATSGWLRPAPVQAPSGVTRFAVPVPTGFQLFYGEIPSLAIWPDGQAIVFATDGRLFYRRLHSFETLPMPRTEGAMNPFFSPDGAWLGFTQGDALMKVPVTGGTPVKIASVSTGNGATWGRDGRIIVAGGIGNNALTAVSENGGKPEQVTTLSESGGETAHMWPEALPDGAVLYTALGPSGHAQDARLVVEGPARGTRTVVAEGVTYGRYVEPGYLLFVDANRTLLLQPFDLAKRRTTGPARAVLSGGRVSTWGGAMPYAVSSTGTLVYATGTELEQNVTTLLDVSGRTARTFGKPHTSQFYSLSPDGRTLAMVVRGAGNDDIFLMDVESGRLDRFTFDVAEDESPVWSSDGRRIAYSSAAVGEQRRIFVKTVGSAEPERLVFTGKRHLHLTSWSPDGKWLTFDEFHPSSRDVWMLNLTDTPRLVPVATTSASEQGAVFSPDGRWLAYTSTETGRSEVYVVSFPDLGGKQQVSRESGVWPQWSATGRELFFVGGDLFVRGRVMRAQRAAATSSLAWQTPVALFEVPNVDSFAVARDGRSFFYPAPNPESPAREIRVVVNWLQEVLGSGR